MTTYKPFGKPVTQSGTEKFKYVGEMLVGAAGSSPGLYYIGARWMDSELGRFVSLDPQLGKLSMPQSMNRYVYCVNNPLRFTDPTGQWFWVAIAAVAGFVGGIVVYAITTPQSEWDLGDALSAGGAGAVAGAVTALTFNPALGASAWAGLGTGTAAATVAAGAMSGAVGGAASYFAEGGIAAARGKPFDWSAKGFAISVGAGAVGGAVGALGGRVLEPLGSSMGSSAGASVLRSFPEEMISDVIDWLLGKLARPHEALMPSNVVSAGQPVVSVEAINTDFVNLPQYSSIDLSQVMRTSQ